MPLGDKNRGWISGQPPEVKVQMGGSREVLAGVSLK